MTKPSTTQSSEWGGLLERASVVIGVGIGLSVIGFVYGCIFIGGPAAQLGLLRRTIGGDSFVLYQCSRAAAGESQHKIATNLGVNASGVPDFCNFYLNRRSTKD